MITPCLAVNISNADLDDEDMADISDWTDGDTGTGDSSQVTFDSKSTMKLYSGTTASTAKRSQDLGVFGTRTIFSVNSYFDTIGTYGNADNSDFYAEDGTTRLQVAFASDGLFIEDGDTGVEVGTDLVVQDAWQEWTFDVNWTAQTVDVYLNRVLQASGVDCSNGAAGTNGLAVFRQKGITTTGQISYIDWFKAGSDFATAERRIIFIQ